MFYGLFLYLGVSQNFQYLPIFKSVYNQAVRCNGCYIFRKQKIAVSLEAVSDDGFFDVFWFFLSISHQNLHYPIEISIYMNPF